MALPTPSRRQLLIGGGAGIGLVVGYTFWPRRHLPSIGGGRGEHVMNGFVRIGEDGHVAIAVPQVELGHGVFTTLAQIVADELGANWRTVAVETAVGRGFGNAVLSAEWRDGLGNMLPAVFESGFPDEFIATGGSSSIRAFEEPLRNAGATAAALLCSAAAARWDIDRHACETHDGFVWFGEQRTRFGEIAREAAAFAIPSDIAWRRGNANRLVATAMPRLDLPAKVDGSVNFAGDIRLPDMVYASLTSGPGGKAKLVSFDEAAARRVTGVLDIVRTDDWVAVAATNGWAAERGVAAGVARFAVEGDRPDNRSIARSLDAALDDGAATRVVAQGDVAAAFRAASIWTQSYSVGLAPHAAIETASATARMESGMLEIWAQTQVPTLAAAAAARATGTDARRIAVHPVMVGGSFGARYEVAIAAHVATLAQRLKRPVQLVMSRTEEFRHDRFRPAAAARMAARTGSDGRIEAWFAQIAAPATLHEMRARLIAGVAPHDAMVAAASIGEPAAVAGAAPPYDIANVAIDHHPALIGVPTGDWRGRAHVASAFFTECFFDEIAHMTGGEPFGARMAMLGGNPRLAQCLTKAAAAGNWQGGVPGSNQGLACHSMAGSYVAVLAEARREGSGIRVDRLVAVADVGRVVNPDVVRAQIIGGLVWGLAAATGVPVAMHRGVAGPATLGALRLPRMADCPRIDVELIVSSADPGGAGEIAVPPVAPAIAGALFAGTGVRYRQLPLIQDA